MSATQYLVFYSLHILHEREIARITIKDIPVTHRYLGQFEAEGIDDLYRLMQGDVWSPNGEARSLIEGAGLHHTSMSCGDVIYNPRSNSFWVVSPCGFKQLDPEYG